MRVSFSIYVLICVLCDRAFASSSILRANPGRLKIFNNLPNNFEYVLKRHKINNKSADASSSSSSLEEDSKDRRSQSTSFIRYGRSHADKDMYTALEETDNLKVSPRGKSPEIVIRYGRNDPAIALFRGESDEEIATTEIDPTTICTDLLLNGGRIRSEMLRFYLPRLYRFCKAMANSINDNNNDSNNDLLLLTNNKQADTKND